MSDLLIRCSVCNQESEPGPNCMICNQVLKASPVQVAPSYRLSVNKKEKSKNEFGQGEEVHCSNCGNLILNPPNCLRCGSFNHALSPRDAERLLQPEKKGRPLSVLLPRKPVLETPAERKRPGSVKDMLALRKMNEEVELKKAELEKREREEELERLIAKRKKKDEEKRRELEEGELEKKRLEEQTRKEREEELEMLRRRRASASAAPSFESNDKMEELKAKPLSKEDKKKQGEIERDQRRIVREREFKRLDQTREEERRRAEEKKKEELKKKLELEAIARKIKVEEEEEENQRVKDIQRRKEREREREEREREKVPKVKELSVVVNFSINGVAFEKGSLEDVFTKVELDELLSCILREEKTREYFSSVVVVKKLLSYLFIPIEQPMEVPPSPSMEKLMNDSGVEEGGLTQQKIKVYCAEIMTNPDSSLVFETVVSNGDLMEYFFSPWKTNTLDSSILRLFDFMMQHRFHAFIRTVQMLDFVIPSMIKHLHLPEVRSLIHAMIGNESLVCNYMPEVFWSRKSIIPLVVERFHAALKNPSDAVEMTLMCEFVGDLLQFHYFSSPHILSEVMEVFDKVTEHILNLETDYAEEFLELFFRFFPKNEALLEPSLQLTVCALADQDDWLNQQHEHVYYHEHVEYFLCRKPFQRQLRVALNSKPISKLSMFRWRAIQIVCRIIFMCSADLDETLIVSGNLQRCLECFFEYSTSSLLHSCILEMLEFMMSNSSEATVCWTFLEFGMIQKALNAYAKQKTASNPNVHYAGHLIRFFTSLDSALSKNTVLEEALASSEELNANWTKFKNSELPEVLASQKYEIEPEKIEREGTILERIASAEQEEDMINASRSSQAEEDEQHLEEVVEYIEEIVEEEEQEEEVVEEEMVEEVFEEIIEVFEEEEE